MSSSADLDVNEPGFDVLHQVHSSGVWSFTTKFRVKHLVPLQNRALIYRVPPLPPGEGASNEQEPASLVIVNPSQLCDSVIASLKKLETDTNSRVRYLVSPGDYHYMRIGDYLPVFPDAKGYVWPGRVPSLKPAFEFQVMDMENPLPELAPHLQVHVTRGLRQLDSPDVARLEAVFFHQASRSICCGDVFHFWRVSFGPPWTWLIPQRLDQIVVNFFSWKRFIADPAGLIWSINKILQWDFDRFLGIHGEPGNFQNEGSHAQVEALLKFLQKPPANFTVSIPFQNPDAEEGAH